MSIGLLRSLAGAVLVIAFPLAHCMPSVEHEAAALFGMEYDAIEPGHPILPGSLSCIENDVRDVHVAGQPHADWQIGVANCSNRHVELLKRRTGGATEPRPAGEWRTCCCCRLSQATVRVTSGARTSAA